MHIKQFKNDEYAERSSPILGWNDTKGTLYIEPNYCFSKHCGL